MESTPVKELLKEVSADISLHLKQINPDEHSNPSYNHFKYASFRNRSSKAVLFKTNGHQHSDSYMHKYSPKCVSREVFPFIDVRNQSYVKKYNLDSKLTSLIQEYALKLQESEERSVIDPNFEKFAKTKLDASIDNTQDILYILADFASVIGFGVASAFVVSNYFFSHSAEYASSSYMIGAMIGIACTVPGENWHHPLGNLFMSSYGKNKVLGTEYYKEKLKEEYEKKIGKYAKRHRPELVKSIEINNHKSVKKENNVASLEIRVA